MRMKNGFLCFVYLMLNLGLSAQVQEGKNIIGFGAGISPAKDYSIWIGDPIDVWANKNASPVIQIFYARQVLPAVRLGTYFEYETATCNFNYSYNDGDYYYNYSIKAKATRYNVGINWLSQYPKTPFHAQFGGYAGYGLVSSSNFGQAMSGASSQNLSGIDFGIMAGPAYEQNNIGIAFHVQSGFGWYHSNESLKDLLLVMPKFILKVYYILP